MPGKPKKSKAASKSNMCTSCGKSLARGLVAKSGRQFCCTYCCDKYFARNKPKVCEFC